MFCQRMLKKKSFFGQRTFLPIHLAGVCGSEMRCLVKKAFIGEKAFLRQPSRKKTTDIDASGCSRAPTDRRVGRAFKIQENLLNYVASCYLLGVKKFNFRMLEFQIMECTNTLRSHRAVDDTLDFSDGSRPGFLSFSAGDRTTIELN